LFLQEIATQRFIPAGNTLLAGAKPITPNCSVVGTLTDENFQEMLELSKTLWKHNTGTGFDLSGLADPVGALRTLCAANTAINLEFGTHRAIMASLCTSHPRIREFISCKAARNDNSLSGVNISVAVGEEGIDSALLLEVAKQAWSTGDPGLFFLPRARRYGPIEATDLQPVVTCVPCGEQFMHAFETCNLGSVNLNAETLWDPTERGLLFDKLGETVEIAVRFLDAVIDLLEFQDDRIRQTSLSTRRIGLGVMGWADLLKRMGLEYGCAESIALAQSLSLFISHRASAASAQLAKEFGPCRYSDTYRNISLTCIAPTGNITNLTGNSGYAIEPFFSEATRLSVDAHVKMQAAWQVGMHNAVSKTVNLPRTATVDDVLKVFKYASEHCKGVTVYRDSSKPCQPMSLGDDVKSCKTCV
jgi:ribonucleoside-diphosphate reductase alpha chain